jgi:hypothetical protein
MYSSTCFGHPHAHHQELNNCSSSLWFYRWNVVVAVLLVDSFEYYGNFCRAIGKAGIMSERLKMSLCFVFFLISVGS